MADLASLAELSHALEHISLAMAGDRVPVPLIVHELETLAAGDRVTIAIALSYLLRHRTLGTHEDGTALADAIDAMVVTLRRTP